MAPSQSFWEIIGTFSQVITIQRESRSKRGGAPGAEERGQSCRQIKRSPPLPSSRASSSHPLPVSPSLSQRDRSRVLKFTTADFQFISRVLEISTESVFVVVNISLFYLIIKGIFFWSCRFSPSASISTLAEKSENMFSFITHAFID